MIIQEYYTIYICYHGNPLKEPIPTQPCHHQTFMYNYNRTTPVHKYNCKQIMLTHHLPTLSTATATDTICTWNTAEYNILNITNGNQNSMKSMETFPNTTIRTM